MSDGKVMVGKKVAEIAPDVTYAAKATTRH